LLPVFVGLAIWAALCAVAALAIMLAFRRLRPFSGFVFLTPLLGVAGALVGFLLVGWFFDKRVRPELASTLAFYFGFLLCGACGSVMGFLAGFKVWNRFRRRDRSQVAQN
jgi:MFS family permease